jgi:hypothetical protein
MEEDVEDAATMVASTRRTVRQASLSEDTVDSLLALSCGADADQAKRALTPSPLPWFEAAPWIDDIFNDRVEADTRVDIPAPRGSRPRETRVDEPLDRLAYEETCLAPAVGAEYTSEGTLLFAAPAVDRRLDGGTEPPASEVTRVAAPLARPQRHVFVPAGPLGVPRSERPITIHPPPYVPPPPAPSAPMRVHYSQQPTVRIAAQPTPWIEASKRFAVVGSLGLVAFLALLGAAIRYSATPAPSRASIDTAAAIPPTVAPAVTAPAVVTAAPPVMTAPAAVEPAPAAAETAAVAKPVAAPPAKVAAPAPIGPASTVKISFAVPAKVAKPTVPVRRASPQEMLDALGEEQLRR